VNKSRHTIEVGQTPRQEVSKARMDMIVIMVKEYADKILDRIELQKEKKRLRKRLKPDSAARSRTVRFKVSQESGS
jgi:hypothetical protein